MIGQELPEFMPGDIILCPGKRIMPHIITRWVTRSHDEPPTLAVHTAQFLSPHRIIEIQTVVKRRGLKQFIKTRNAFEVWRCSSLSLEERRAIARKSLEYMGTKYGWSKLSTHLLDGLINKVVHRQVFFFRKLNHDQRYPICSWITAFSYDRAVHYDFGVPPEGADPDQIRDWVISHSDEWVCVFSLVERPARSKIGRRRPVFAWRVASNA